MIQLLKSSNKRLLNIAELVTLNPAGVPVTKIVEVNECSFKTAYEDIKTVISLSKMTTPEFKNSIFSNPNTSISLLIDFKRRLMHTESKFKIISNILFNPNFDIYDHSIFLNYSETHIRNSIKEINDYLYQYNISIIYCPKESRYLFEFEDPFQFIYLISQLLKESRYDYLLPQLSSKDEMNLETLIDDVDINFSSHSLCQIKLFLKTLRLTEKQYQIDLNIIELLHYRINLYRDYLEEILNQELDHYLKTYGYHTDLTKRKKIIGAFMYLTIRHSLVPKRTKTGMDRFDYFYDYQRTQNNLLFIEINKIIENISQLSVVDSRSQHNEMYFLIHQQLQSYLINKRKRISVYSDLGMTHVENLIAMIEEKFSNLDTDIHDNSSHPDLLITTRLSSKFENLPYPVICISDALTDRDISNIIRILEL